MKNLNRQRRVLIYRDTLFGPSEAFIPAQGESLTQYVPIYGCLRRSGDLPVPESRVHVLCGEGLMGQFERLAVKLCGPRQRQLSAVRSLDPVLLHAHFATDASEIMNLAEMLRIPLLVSLHGYDINSDDGQLPRRFLRRRERLKNVASLFICVSEFIRSRALDKGFPKEKLVVHYTGVDTECFGATAWKCRRPSVLFVGRLVPNKGCEYLLRAMAHVQRLLPDTKLTVIGGGPLRGRLQALAVQLRLNCEFLGSQSHAAVKNWMGQARVLCVPSIVTPTAHEAFGIVFAEAQASGLPVVSSSIGGIPEVVSDQLSGFLVRERDAEALAERILRLLQDDVLWNSFSQAGRALVHDRFNVVKQSRILEAIYDGIAR